MCSLLEELRFTSKAPVRWRCVRYPTVIGPCDMRYAAAFVISGIERTQRKMKERKKKWTNQMVGNNIGAPPSRMVVV